MTEATLSEILADPNYMLLRRLPEKYEKQAVEGVQIFSGMIIDLETMGLNAQRDSIIELGLLKFNFTNQHGIIEVVETYNELNDPHRPIPEEVTKITGITDKAVAGKEINWDKISQLLKETHLIICHNAAFDRNFLEIQTPPAIQAIFKKMPFACSVKDIDWSARGFESRKLDYLNWKLGYFYDAHRALTDCWATFNLLVQEKGAFEELKENAKRTDLLICAVNAPFEQKDKLKQRGYKWSDGTGSLPKCWWIMIPQAAFEIESEFLDSEIYARKNAAQKLPYSEIKAFSRYSFRAEELR